ncbi:hypothetical protein L3073_16380 [Ancylomarina sp. DW003]|nr:porin [Ancylomarina sp. DW003]MDE5423792.1 hypothetical protein [Ancylomarina sp. DW003]
MRNLLAGALIMFSIGFAGCEDDTHDLGAALGGAGNMSIQGGKAETISAAVNYYLNDNVMFRLNYSYMDVQNQVYPLDEKVGMIKARVQVNF